MKVTLEYPDPKDGDTQPTYGQITLFLEVPATWSDVFREWQLPIGAADIVKALTDKVNTFAQLTLGEMAKTERPHGMTVLGGACMLERAAELTAPPQVVWHE